MLVRVVCFLVFGILLCWRPVALAQDMRLPRVVVASGGPYQLRTESLQKFKDIIEIPREYINQPLSLVATNGGESAPGYSWVRMFMLPRQSDADLQTLQEPVGRLLIDEYSFQKSAQVYIDMTAQFPPGANRLHIEGAGRQGAVFNWEIRSIGTPFLYMPPQISTTAGEWLEINGCGFSLRPEENTVMLGQTQLAVSRSNFSSLQAFVPKQMPPGNYQLYVALRQYKSRPINALVLKPKSDN